MSLSPGERLGVYRVTGKLGEGGMGEVYAARDTKLDRDVALKVLAPDFVSDPDRRARFEREAKILASLSHPNIAAIHGVEESGSTQTLVLERVDGPTLADRIARGPIPVDEALPMARQVAEALEAAHDAGVVHRDLKPANIKLKHDGTVKVLDFGLAKVQAGSARATDDSPTRTAAGTASGVILGSAAYMSPEQARGEAVDRRTDLWAFGVVLYEMLTGRRLFEGKTATEVLARVLEHPVSLRALPGTTPAAVRRLLRRCLERGTRRRLRDAGEAVVLLDEAVSSPDASEADAQGRPSSTGWRWALPWVAAASVAVALTTGLTVWRLTQPAAPPVVRFALTHHDGPLYYSPRGADLAISPDGTMLAYLTGNRGPGAAQLHVRRLDQLTPATLVAEGSIIEPFFSADGQQVGFSDRSVSPPVLKRVATAGGPVSTICALPGVLQGTSWSTDGTIVFAAEGRATGLFRVPAVGGEPELLTTPTPEEFDHAWPEILPGGRAVLFATHIYGDGDPQVAVLSLDSGDHHVLVDNGTYPRYSPTGHLLFARRDSLWAVAFDLGSLETVGEPFPVVEGVRTSFGVASGATYAVSRSGTLAYMPVIPGWSDFGSDRTLVWVDRDGREEPAGAPPAAYDGPRISPDGQRVAVEISNPDNAEIMIYDLAQGRLTQLTFDPGHDRFPVWTPDGDQIIFSSDRDGRPSLYARAADGTGSAVRIWANPAAQWPVPSAWAPDGRLIVFQRSLTEEDQSFDLFALSLGAEARLDGVRQTSETETGGVVSPDGQWLAYFETGRLVVRPYPDTDDGRWEVRSGFSPVWSRDGQELFFRNNQDTSTVDMMVVSVETGASSFVHGNPEYLFPAPYRGADFTPRTRAFDLADDGRFLMIGPSRVESEANLHLVVVVNWAEELLRLAAAASGSS